MTISRHLKFGTSEMIKSQKESTLLATIKQVQSKKMQGGFQITNILLDGQFESICGDAAGIRITLNVISQDKHITEAERYI
jgi:hypothetical protein